MLPLAHPGHVLYIYTGASNMNIHTCWFTIVAMENTSSSLTNLLNAAITSGDPQNPPSQQYHFPATQYPMNYPPTQFPPNFNPQYPHIFSCFGGQSSSSYPQYPFVQGSYQGPHQGLRQQTQEGSQASPVGSMAFFQGSRGSDSRADESSPVGSYWRSLNTHFII